MEINAVDKNMTQFQGDHKDVKYIIFLEVIKFQHQWLGQKFQHQQSMIIHHRQENLMQNTP